MADKYTIKRVSNTIGQNKYFGIIDKKCNCMVSGPFITLHDARTMLRVLKNRSKK